MTAVLTVRDLDLLQMLNRACWLTTLQIHHSYFQNVSINATQKRLRRLAGAGFLFHARPSRTEQSFWRLGPKGISRLQASGFQTQPVPKRIPGNLQHFLTINEIRLWFIRNFRCGPCQLKTFVAEWELKRGRRLTVIPDALVALIEHGRSFTIAIEVDLGTENLTFFHRTKIENYRHFFTAEPNERRYVMVVVEGRSRMKAIAGKLYGHGNAEFVVAESQQFLAGDLETLTLVPLFDIKGGAVCCSFVDLLDSPHQVSSREETPLPVSN